MRLVLPSSSSTSSSNVYLPVTRSITQLRRPYRRCVAQQRAATCRNGKPVAKFTLMTEMTKLTKDKPGCAANFSTKMVSMLLSHIKRIRMGDRSFLFHGRESRSYGRAARASCFSMCWIGNMTPLALSFCYPICSHLGISPNTPVYCIKDSHFANVSCMYDSKYFNVITTLKTAAITVDTNSLLLDL